MGAEAITVDDVAYNYGDIQAVKDVTFGVEEGEIFGFLGPNGAGKTTLIKILMGLSKPTSGEASVFGESPRVARVKSRVGFLPESPYFYEYLTAAEFLGLSAALSSVPGVASEYQVHLYRREDGRDVMVLKVERTYDDTPDGDRRLAEMVTNEIREHILVRPQVEILEYGMLPRTERKSKRVFDHRNDE